MDRLMDLEDKVRSSAVACICDAAAKNLQVDQALAAHKPSLCAAGWSEQPSVRHTRQWFC